MAEVPARDREDFHARARIPALLAAGGVSDAAREAIRRGNRIVHLRVWIDGRDLARMEVRATRQRAPPAPQDHAPLRVHPARGGTERD